MFEKQKYYQLWGGGVGGVCIYCTTLFLSYHEQEKICRITENYSELYFLTTPRKTKSPPPLELCGEGGKVSQAAKQFSLLALANCNTGPIGNFLDEGNHRAGSKAVRSTAVLPDAETLLTPCRRQPKFSPALRLSP
jgi:hypothetical protein